MLLQWASDVEIFVDAAISKEMGCAHLISMLRATIHLVRICKKMVELGHSRTRASVICAVDRWPKRLLLKCLRRRTPGLGPLRLWREKRGETEPEDLSGNLVVQLGSVTEDLNRRWYEFNTGLMVRDIQKHVKHPTLRWMAATLDGVVEGTGAVFEAKFMLPWAFSEEAAAAKHMAQLQHNMWVIQSRSAALSIIPAAANGSNSRSMPIRSTSIYC